MKKISFTLVFVAILLPVLLGNNTIASNGINIPLVDQTIQELQPGDIAPDFTVTDVDSNISYTLSTLLSEGKTVFIDTWATWCGPCKASLPFLQDIYSIYPQEVVTMISIDESGSDTLELVQQHRKSDDMDWIVSFNTSGTVLDDYMVSGIPTFFVVDPDGRISWSQVGYAEEYRTIFLDQLKTIFPEDTVNPVIEEASVTSDTEISIFYPEVAVYANVTDNWRATGALLILDNGVDEVQYDLNLKLMDEYKLINQNISLDPLLLYGYTTVNVKIKVLDYYENSATETIALGLTEYVDTGAPVINAYSYNVTQVDESKFNVEVFLDVTEDLLIVEANLYIYKGTMLKKTAFFAEYNATHMKATVYSIFYVDGQPTEYSIKIEVIDAVGNVAEIEVMIEEAANARHETWSSLPEAV
ncbi:MAG: TlpA family protein disulfide reductase [Candidatus Heimdallarchaeaceae archaeon]